MEILYKELKKSFSHWSNINRKTLINDLDEFYNMNLMIRKLVRIEIINNKLYYDNNHMEGVYNNLFYDRTKNIIKLFELALDRINKNKIKLRNFRFYFTINDYNVSKKLPIFAFSKPINTVGILIPDWTFIDLFENKIKSDWDDVKNTLNHIKHKNKEDIIFFQGKNTSKIMRAVREYKNDIRENLKILSQNNKYFIVKIDEPPTPITEWVKYKYLLDLPGAYPWSVRFKELLMMKSLVIKIDINEPWINFYSSLLKPNVDYIQIKYDNNDEPEKLAKNVYNKIIGTYKYMEKNTQKFNKMVNSAYKNINKLTMDGIIDYLVLVLKLTEELLYDENLGKTKKTKKVKSSISKKTKKHLINQS